MFSVFYPLGVFSFVRPFFIDCPLSPCMLQSIHSLSLRHFLPSTSKNSSTRVLCAIRASIYFHLYFQMLFHLPIFPPLLVVHSQLLVYVSTPHRQPLLFILLRSFFKHTTLNMTDVTPADLLLPSLPFAFCCNFTQYPKYPRVPSFALCLSFFLSSCHAPSLPFKRALPISIISSHPLS